ncbi:hypothetical protein CEXT_791561 [Caerostris extrusa]|uniref:Uncharacterized protein n=1 Tax=Caerostris extrusa TaxID=172846 RepID=A0AAV4XB55_CAEEX|nr:hypothetical protein CEXT_791561 [Caerostris extrusa]
MSQFSKTLERLFPPAGAASLLVEEKFWEKQNLLGMKKAVALLLLMTGRGERALSGFGRLASLLQMGLSALSRRALCRHARSMEGCCSLPLDGGASF